MKIYVASSWRNQRQPVVVEKLKAEGFDVYDFRHPETGENGFHWYEIDKNWQTWTPYEFIRKLKHPLAEIGYNKGIIALNNADVVVLVSPCGRSAHLELGYAVGRLKKTAILLCNGEPEIMYRMATKVFSDISCLIYWLKQQQNSY